MKIISDSVQCPVIANGGVKNLNEVLKLHEETNCHGKNRQKVYEELDIMNELE